jgi:hypothetical protein
MTLEKAMPTYFKYKPDYRDGLKIDCSTPTGNFYGNQCLNQGNFGMTDCPTGWYVVFAVSTYSQQFNNVH